MCWKKAIIAMSGGVDSSVAALLSVESGMDCIGGMMKLFSKSQLSRTRLPLGGFTKTQVRKIAREHGFINAAKRDESQRAVTKGQAVVLYDEEIVIGGGTICEIMP